MRSPVVERPRAIGLAELVERELASALRRHERASPSLARAWREALVDPTRDFLGRPGKQFRARLVRAAWGLAGGGADAMPEELPLVVELLHAGSLVVDDVQDGSQLRRGAPALHLEIGVPLAINAGNLLYALALERLAHLALPPARELELARRAARAMLRCHEGQALDLAVRAFELPRREVSALVLASTRRKAGALMELAAACGAVGAGASHERVDALCAFGRALGLALQMLDDLSGFASARRREKAREDLRLARPTWAWAWLARESSDEEYSAFQERAGDVAGGADPDALIGEFAARVVPLGRRRVHRHLARALDALRRACGDSMEVGELEGEIARLEASYG